MEEARKCPACKRTTRYIAPNAIRCGHCLDEITLKRGYAHVLAGMTADDLAEFVALARDIAGWQGPVQQ